MKIMGVNVMVECTRDCRLKYIIHPESICSLCKYYIRIDVPRITEFIIQAKIKAEKAGREIEEIRVKNDIIESIIYSDWYEENKVETSI